MPTAVSLFSGCGGSDAGLIAAGFTVVMANDVVDYARQVYQANLPPTQYLVKDVRKLTDFPAADLLVGCYPCQGFSQGGAREAGRRINTLYEEFARALAAIEPKAFIAENVSGMRNSRYRHLLDDQLTRFSTAGRHGYSVKWAELRADHYGVAQERRRVVLVGLRRDLGVDYQFPLASHGIDGGQPILTQAQALAGCPAWPDGEFCAEPFHWYYLSRNRHRNWNEPAKTVVGHWRQVPLHPSSPALVKLDKDRWQFSTAGPARRISYREAARLQGLDARFTVHGGDWIFPETCSVRQRFMVVGNAVPPPLFEAVARQLPPLWA